MFRATFIIARRIVRHPATWMLAWTYRDVLALWARSLAGELRETRAFDADRVQRLAAGLWSATRGTDFAVRPLLTEIRLVDTDPSFDATVGEPLAVPV